MMDMMMVQMKQMAQENLKKRVPDVTQKHLKWMDSMTDAALKSYNADNVLDDMIPIYQRHLTKADVSAMLAFYESPAGKKLVKEQPALAG